MTNRPNIRKPRNSFETFKWAIFEPVLLKKYSDSLNWREGLLEFLKAYIWVVVLTLTIYCVSNFIIAVFDLPLLFMNIFKSELVNNWPVNADVLSKFLFISKMTIGGLVVGLAGGLAFGFAGGFAFGFAGELAFGLAGGIAFGLAGGLAFGLAGGLAFGLAVGLTLGLAFGLTFGLTLELAGGLTLGFAGGLTLARVS